MTIYWPIIADDQLAAYLSDKILVRPDYGYATEANLKSLAGSRYQEALRKQKEQREKDNKSVIRSFNLRR